MFFRIAAAAALLVSPLHADDFSVGDTFDDPMVVAMDVFEGFPPEEEGRPGIEIDVSMDFFGQMTILVAETGFADDSVAGLRRQYVLSEIDDVWEITFIRTQVLCGRGANTVTWQTNPCP